MRGAPTEKVRWREVAIHDGRVVLIRRGEDEVLLLSGSQGVDLQLLQSLESALWLSVGQTVVLGTPLVVTYQRCVDRRFEGITFRRLAALKLMSRWLTGASRGLQSLIVYVDSLSVSGREDPDEPLQVAVKQLCTAQQIPVSDDQSLKPSGNEITALLHWQLLVVLASMLETHQQVSLRQQFKLSAEEKDSLPQPLGGLTVTVI